MPDTIQLIQKLIDYLGGCSCGGKTGQEAHTNPDGLGDTESIICRKCGAVTQVTIGEMTPEEANAILGG